MAGVCRWQIGVPAIAKESLGEGSQCGEIAVPRRDVSHTSHASVESLQHPWLDRFWEAMYWADPNLPFVDAAYGSAAFAYVEPGRVQEVSVSITGYLIRRSQLKEIPVTPLNT